jgi:hypothetical protein
MLWFHQDRPETGHRVLRIDFRKIFPGILWKKARWELRECKVKVAPGGLVKNALGEGRGGLRGGGADGPNDDIQLRRRRGRHEVRRFGKVFVEFECGGMARFEALREGAAGSVGEQLLCSPESDRGGAGAGALEGDFAEVEIFRGEVGVGRVVFVEAADGRVAEEDATTAVGLEAVFVRVDDDGVGVGDGVEGGEGFGEEIGGKGEVATVGGVDMDAELILFLEGDDLIERIDGADRGCP